MSFNNGCETVVFYLYGVDGYGRKPLTIYHKETDTYITIASAGDNVTVVCLTSNRPYDELCHLLTRGQLNNEHKITRITQFDTDTFIEDDVDLDRIGYEVVMVGGGIS